MANLAFHLQVDHDALEAYLEVVPADENSLATPEALNTALHEQNVTQGIDQPAIEDAFKRLPEMNEPGERIVIARGKAAVPGVRGRIDFKVDISGKARFRKDESATGEERVDFREAVSFPTVKPGDVLAEIIPPTPGENGKTLSGKTIQFRPGKPAFLKAGEGVETDREERIFTATSEGRPVHAGGVLAVSPRLEINSDIDYATGNVSFPGHVYIRGSVKDDFTVDAGSAEINGGVGAATVRTANDLLVRGGISGREKARIECGGTFEAKYVNQATVIAQRDVSVNREIVNSTVWCLGRLTAGKILGGESLALGGIEANLLGSEIGVHTLLLPGMNYRTRRIDQRLEELDAEIETLLRPVAPFFGERARYKNLPEERQEAFRLAWAHFRQIREEHRALTEEKRAILADAAFAPVKEVTVRKTLLPDVAIRTDLCARHFRTTVTGPARLIEDVETGSIITDSEKSKKKEAAAPSEAGGQNEPPAAEAPRAADGAPPAETAAGAENAGATAEETVAPGEAWKPADDERRAS
jgi:hypothetical protein